MPAIEEQLAVTEIDWVIRNLKTSAALLKREFEYLPDGDVMMTELWDCLHPACPYAVADAVTRKRRTDVPVVGRRVKMTTDEWRGRYGPTALN